jgi:hypothetical protein
MLGDLCLEGKMILKRILRGIICEDMDWINLAEDSV